MVCLGANVLFSQENLKLMFYNVLNYPLQEPASRIQDLSVIIDDYRPDLFMICELNNEEGADNILNIMQSANSNYQRAVFQFNTSDDAIGNQNDLQNMIFYDGSKFTLESQHIVNTLYRDFNHYILKLKTVNQDTNPIYLYTSSEPAFQELIDTNNNITFVDPADRVGSWHNNLNYLDMFTQSTRTQSGTGGSTGGFDDRFDFILTSENMLTNTDLYYVADSYQVYGNNNNANCWNKEINSTDCAGNDFNYTIRDALYNMSDHLPVTLELQTTETLSVANVTYSNGIKFVGSNVVSEQLQVNLTASNINSLTIFNLVGQQIQELNVNNTTSLTIDVSRFASGIYYISASNQLNEPLKFVIQ